MSEPVFICADVSRAVVGARIVVKGDEARHASVVSRIGVGERLTAVDGYGRRASGVVDVSTATKVELLVDEMSREEDRPVVLVQALAKNGRDEQAVESATELGVTRVVPWSASRSISVWRGPKRSKGRDKWAALALRATKQSRRALVPTVDELADTKQVARLVGEAVADGARAIVLHEESSSPVADMPWTLEPGQPVWLIVGPEGGISTDELAAFQDAGAQVGLLGPHVLRASSAGPAAIAAIAALSGDWGGKA